MIPSCCYLRTYIFKELNFTSCQRLEKCILPCYTMLSNRHCHTSDNDEPGKLKSNEPESKIEKKEKVKQRMNDLLQTFHKKSYAPQQEIGIYKAKQKFTASKEQEAQKDEIEIVDFSLREAAKKVAKSLGGDVAETESELLQALRSHASPKQSLSDIISNMQVSSKISSDDLVSEKIPRSRLYEFRRERGSATTYDSKDEKYVDVFGAPPLNIFPTDFVPEGKESLLSTWDAVLEREKKLCINNEPKNYFEEMIKWTEAGKVWSFPIDNETGLDEEKEVSFADHIFLEKHLVGWCPTKGPISHFMELVCVGLSKNPYITVERKKAHIEWYKNYFESKADILKDLGAM